MMSRDTGPTGDAKALKWAVKEKFPWVTVLASVPEWKKNFSFMKYKKRGVPQYVLVDKDGNKLAEGLAQALKYIDEPHEVKKAVVPATKAVVPATKATDSVPK